MTNEKVKIFANQVLVNHRHWLELGSTFLKTKLFELMISSNQNKGFQNFGLLRISQL